MAIRAMHEYRPSTPRSAAAAQREASEAAAGSSGNGKARQREDDDDDDERFPQAEGDAEGGYSYDGSSVPLVTKQRVVEADVVFDGDEDITQIADEQGQPGPEVVPYAHRDLKPGYVDFCLALN